MSRNFYSVSQSKITQDYAVVIAYETPRNVFYCYWKTEGRINLGCSGYWTTLQHRKQVGETEAAKILEGYISYHIFYVQILQISKLRFYRV